MDLTPADPSSNFESLRHETHNSKIVSVVQCENDGQGNPQMNEKPRRSTSKRAITIALPGQHLRLANNRPRPHNQRHCHQASAMLR